MMNCAVKWHQKLLEQELRMPNANIIMLLSIFTILFSGSWMFNKTTSHQLVCDIIYNLRCMYNFFHKFEYSWQRMVNTEKYYRQFHSLLRIMARKTDYVSQHWHASYLTFEKCKRFW